MTAVNMLAAVLCAFVLVGQSPGGSPGKPSSKPSGNHFAPGARRPAAAGDHASATHTEKAHDVRLSGLAMSPLRNNSFTLAAGGLGLRAIVSPATRYTLQGKPAGSSALLAGAQVMVEGKELRHYVYVSQVMIGGYSTKPHRPMAATIHFGPGPAPPVGGRLRELRAARTVR